MRTPLNDACAAALLRTLLIETSERLVFLSAPGGGHRRRNGGVRLAGHGGHFRKFRRPNACKDSFICVVVGSGFGKGLHPIYHLQTTAVPQRFCRAKLTVHGVFNNCCRGKDA